MNRTERLYAIVGELRRAGERGRSSSWLAQRFEVSTRTIKRDISALCEAGVPIWAAEGRAGGYGLARVETLAPIAFTEAEASAIALALATSERLPFAADGRAALTKLLDHMPEATRQAARALAGRLWLRGEEVTRPPALREIEEALRQQVAVTIDFTDLKGQSTTRTIEPMALACSQRQWSVLAWCRLRDAGRWFAVARITRATLTREALPARDLAETFGTPPDDARPLALG